MYKNYIIRYCDELLILLVAYDNATDITEKIVIFDVIMIYANGIVKAMNDLLNDELLSYFENFIEKIKNFNLRCNLKSTKQLIKAIKDLKYIVEEML